MSERVSRLALAFGGGFLVALAMPPWGFWPLAFVGVAVFEIALGPAPARVARWWRGFLFGLAWMSMGMGWMSELTWPGYIVAFLFFAALHGIAELCAPNGRWRVIGRPAAHTLVEALRFSFPFGGVPLASLGISQADGPLLGIARVGGVILLTWVVFQVGFALGTIIETASVRETNWPAFGGIAGAVVVLFLSLVAPHSHATGQTLDIAAVQGGGKQGTSALDVPSIEVSNAHLAATRTIQPDPSLDLVLWPENVVDTDNFAASEQYRAIVAEAARLGVPIAVGVTEDVPGRPGRITNYEVVVTPTGSAHEPVRQGEASALRRVRAAARAPEGAWRARRPGPHERHRRQRAGVHRPAEW